MDVYSTDPANRMRSSVTVGIADLAVTDEGDELRTSGLGSCIAVAVYDESSGVAGLAHAMLPRAAGDPAEAKFVDTATAGLVRDLRAAGGSLDRARAKLAGGSEMFEFTGEQAVGPRNVVAARAALDDHGVPVVASDVGGDSGRSVRLRRRSGELVVRTAGTGERVI